MKSNKKKYLGVIFLCAICSLLSLSGCGNDEHADTTKKEKTSEVKKKTSETKKEKKEPVKNIFSNYHLTKDFEESDDVKDSVWDVKISWIKPKSNSIDVKYIITNISSKTEKLNLRDTVLSTYPHSLKFVVSGPDIGWLDDKYKNPTIKSKESIELTLRYGENEDAIRKQNISTKERYMIFNGKNGDEKKVFYDSEIIDFQKENENNALNLDKNLSKIKEKADHLAEQDENITVTANKNSVAISPFAMGMPETTNLSDSESTDFSYTKAVYKAGKWEYVQGIYSKKKGDKIVVDGKEYANKNKEENGGMIDHYIVSNKPIFNGKQKIEIMNNGTVVDSYDVNTLVNLEEVVKKINS